MRPVFRQLVAISITVLLSLTSALPALAQGSTMPAPSPGISPLAPPCETDPNGATCGSGLDQPTTPIDHAIKLVEEEIKRLEDAREAAQNCLEGGAGATCEPLDLPSGTDCPEGAQSRNCAEPPTPASTSAIDEAIKFIEGLLQDPEPDTPPPGYPLPGPDGKPIVDEEKVLQEGPDTVANDQSCAAIAKLQAQKEQMEFELERTKNQIFEINNTYSAERAAIKTASAEEIMDFEETFNALKDQLENLRIAEDSIYERQYEYGLKQYEIDNLNQISHSLENLYWTYSRMTASRQRIKLSGGERLANSYKNYLDRVVPKWNMRLSLQDSLQTITEQIRQLSASCE